MKGNEREKLPTTTKKKIRKKFNIKQSEFTEFKNSTIISTIRFQSFYVIFVE